MMLIVVCVATLPFKIVAIKDNSLISQHKNFAFNFIHFLLQSAYKQKKGGVKSSQCKYTFPDCHIMTI